jgi:hypothetical protein
MGTWSHARHNQIRRIGLGEGLSLADEIFDIPFHRKCDRGLRGPSCLDIAEAPTRASSIRWVTERRRSARYRPTSSNRKAIMPLLRFDLIEGRSESELKKILDVTHEVLIDTLQVPKHDRYQVVQEHKRPRIVIEDTGLGFVRSDKIIVLQITSRPRKREFV